MNGQKCHHLLILEASWRWLALEDAQTPMQSVCMHLLSQGGSLWEARAEYHLGILVFAVLPNLVLRPALLTLSSTMALSPSPHSPCKPLLFLLRPVSSPSGQGWPVNFWAGPWGLHPGVRHGFLGCFSEPLSQAHSPQASGLELRMLKGIRTLTG